MIRLKNDKNQALKHDFETLIVMHDERQFAFTATVVVSTLQITCDEGCQTFGT